jgi:hypothetical protein
MIHVVVYVSVASGFCYWYRRKFVLDTIVVAGAIVSTTRESHGVDQSTITSENESSIVVSLSKAAHYSSLVQFSLMSPLHPRLLIEHHIP